jgi:hypothetical protein
MGHQRLARLPRSRPWNYVVGLIVDHADTAAIAAAASQAAERSMIDASEDPITKYSMWFLARLPLAARERDFHSTMSALGLQCPDRPSLADIVCAVMAAIDHKVPVHKRTDYGEIAELSAAEAMYYVFGREYDQLFDAGPDHTQSVIASFGTVAQFPVLARDFFARLIRRHLDYYLSRELSRHVGPGRRFATVREHQAFEAALDQHCRETTRIIQEYSGEWLSKQNFQGGIDLGKAGRFVSYASEKIRDELRERRAAHA